MTSKRQLVPANDQIAQLPDGTRDTPRIVAIAWPTGRPIHPYTADELAAGVDLYTRAMKARAAGATRDGNRDEDQ